MPVANRRTSDGLNTLLPQLVLGTSRDHIPARSERAPWVFFPGCWTNVWRRRPLLMSPSSESASRPQRNSVAGALVASHRQAGRRCCHQRNA